MMDNVLRGKKPYLPLILLREALSPQADARFCGFCCTYTSQSSGATTRFSSCPSNWTMSTVSEFKPLLGTTVERPWYNYSLLTSYAFLDQSVGYGVVVGTVEFTLALSKKVILWAGVGFFFAAIMLVLTTLQSKFSKFSPSSSEEFTVCALGGCVVYTFSSFASERF